MPKLFLDEQFNHKHFDPRLQWLNPPARWHVDPEASVLIVEPKTPTDFWRKTHYGFEADNGHLLYASIEGDFVMTSNIRFHPVHQYDQAGLMVRLDENCWLKTSVEYELLQPAKLGVVVTNAGYSDWSMQDFDKNRNEIGLRVSRSGNDCVVDFSTDADAWTPLRVAHLHGTSSVAQCGVYACSPKGAGFRAEFRRLQIETLKDSL
jgi:uncharacterized protein